MDRVRCGEGWVLRLRCPGTGGGDLDSELDRLAARADALLTLLGDAELARLGVGDLGARAEARGMAWVQAPIGDFDAPADAFETAFAAAWPMLRERLAAGGTVAVHCRAGLGRTGTVAARMLVEHGADPEEAIAAVRRARPGTLETEAQVAHVRAHARNMTGRTG